MPSDQSHRATTVRPAARAPVSPVASVVLCVRNGERTIGRQLAALHEQDYAGSWEVVIVDNASTDGTRAVIDRMAGALPDCRVLTESRIGLNVARNRATGAARAAKVVLCDADDEVSPGWLGRMVEALDRYDVVGGTLDVELLNPPSVRHQAHNQTDGLPEFLGRPYAVGANLAFRKEVWEAVGGFDGTFGFGCDETDFCLRAQDAGYTIGFEPGAVVHYRLRAELGGVAKQHYSYGRGAERMIAKRSRLGLVDGSPRTRWRTLAADVGRHLVETPALLADRARRRLCVERTAFLTGRLVELVRLAVARPVAGAAAVDPGT